jgi:hypothetical protein
LDVKVEKAFNDRKGKQVIAQHGIPLKNAQTQESLRMRAKKKVAVVHEVSDFRRKGRKYFVGEGLNIGEYCVEEPGFQCRWRMAEEGGFERDVRRRVTSEWNTCISKEANRRPSKPLSIERPPTEGRHLKEGIMS